MSRKNLICEYCGTRLSYNQSRFCSDSCRAGWVNRNTRKKPYNKKPKGRKNLICEGCGKLLEGKQNRFCSKSCSGSRVRKGKYKLYGPNIVCEWCGKFLGYKQSRFCSKSCRGSWKCTNNQPRKGTKLTPEQVNQLSINVRRARSNYQYDPDKPQEEYRRKAIEAYGYECSSCGQSEGILHVHHLDGNHYNDDLSNLVVLCTSCHTRIHSGGAHIIDEVMTEYVISRRDS